MSDAREGHGPMLGGDPVIGFTAGLFVDVALGRIWSFQPEMVFTQKGQSGERVGYVDLTLLVKARFPGDRARRPYVVLGPVVAGRAREPFRGDAGVVLGVGIELVRDAESPFTFGVDLRYGVGFVPIYSGSDARNRWLALTVTTGLPMPS